MRRQVVRGLAVAASLATVVVGGSFALGRSVREPSSASSTAEQATPSLKVIPEGAPSPALRDFPMNSLGMTFGSDTNARSLEDSPDLVAVVGDSGVFGYVRKEDLAGPRFRTPEQALRWQENQGRAPVVLSVFDEGGVAIVDTFTMTVPDIVNEQDPE